MDNNIIFVDISKGRDFSDAVVTWRNNGMYTQFDVGKDIVNENEHPIGIVLQCDDNCVTGLIWDENLIRLLIKKDAVIQVVKIKL